jgi:polysaccharide export outer membrane protein
MKSLVCAMLLIVLLSNSVPVVAQQSATNPVPSATPGPAQVNAAPPVTAPAAAPPAAPAAQDQAAPAATAPVEAAPTATAPAATGVPPVAAAPVDAARYVIGTDDSIAVSVWKEPTLSGTFPVRPDGMISLALVGDITAAGRTPMDLANDLTARLKKYITDPTVTVTVLAVNSKRIFLLGEIAHIGPLPLTTSLSPLQAIAAAGGLTPYANKTHIYILRGEQGKQKKIPYDYKKAIKNGDDQGVVLLPGDTIVVP